MHFAVPSRGKIHYLLISENEFAHEIKCNGMTSFMEFMTVDPNIGNTF